MTSSKTLSLEQLNIEQQNAVKKTEGPVLILAGAGSGKTRVLTYRIAYLIQKKNIPTHNILAVTFTNKAAGEMRERVYQLIGKQLDLWIGTFHSVFAKILRVECKHLGYKTNFCIYDKDDQVLLIKKIIADLNIQLERLVPKSVAAAISKAKNGLIAPNEFKARINSTFEETVSRIYPEYQKRLKESNAFDFDDLITIPIILFQKHPEILKKYQNRFRYILVDEYQDTNRAQYHLIHALSKNHKNICVVGDEDQSIYRWRGAEIRNILDFEKDFPETKVFFLEQNYRSTKNILIAASSVVEKNTNRKGKKLWSENDQGEKIELFELDDERDEAQEVIQQIQNQVFKNKRTFQDFAILYRTNAQSRIIEDELRKSGMAYTIVGGVRFYERKEIKDILAYLKFISNPHDGVSLRRIINFPPRGIGANSIAKCEIWAEQRQIDLFSALLRISENDEIKNYIKNNVLQFCAIIQKYIALKNQITLNELVHALIDEIGMIRIYKEDSSFESQSRIDNIHEFIHAVQDYITANESPTLESFLAEVSLISDIDTWEDQQNVITLMTLHCAKGLEFPIIFITGLEEGLFPVFRSFEDPEALEEERRLFYVGLTRAKEQIFLFRAQNRNLFADSSYRMPSRFLNEIDTSVILFNEKVSRFQKRRSKESIFQTRSVDPHPDYENYSQDNVLLRNGMTIQHQEYGKGRIVHIDGYGMKQKVTVHFEGGIKKKFLMKYARFQFL